MKKETKSNPLLCMGLARLIGLLFFLAVSIPIGYLLLWINNIHVNSIMDILNTGGWAYVSCGIAILLGGIAWGYGERLGSKISIYDDDFASGLNRYWHYVISGALVWLVSSIIIVAAAFGDKNAMIDFYSTSGKNSFYFALLFGALTGAVITTIIDLGKHTEYETFWNDILPLTVTFLAGLAYFRAVYEDVPTVPIVTAAFGVLFPYAIRFYSDYMHKKDQRKRGEISL